MERRQFLQTTLALGAAMLPGGKLTASGLLSPSPMVEPSMPIWDAAVDGRWNIVKQWLKRDPSLIAVTGDVGIGKNMSLLHLAVAARFFANPGELATMLRQEQDVKNVKSNPIGFAMG